jgi:hypothetical protein
VGATTSASVEGGRSRRGRGRRSPPPRAQEDSAAAVSSGGFRRCELGKPPAASSTVDGREGGIATCYAGGARAQEADDRRRRDQGDRPVAARAGDSGRGRAAKGRPAGGQHRQCSTWEGKKIRVSKSKNIINNFKILKIKIQIQNVLCHHGYWIDRWAVTLPVVYSMYATATNISVVYTLSVRHRCVRSCGVQTVHHG